MQTVRHYYPEPTPADFHADDSFVRGLRGPIGSGKSVACCMEIIRRATRQSPNAQGVRRSRWAIVRNTYGELKSTTIKTWQEWVPESACPIVFDAPIRGELNVALGDGTKLHMELLFIALDRPDHVRKLLSLELTGAWLNEAREIPKAILDGLTGRVGRFPALMDGGSSWSGIIMDTNPPDDDHWWYRLAEEGSPQGYRFWAQPPALVWDDQVRVWKLNPAAENVSNHSLGGEYWLRQVPGKTREWILVYLCGQYGSVREGKPVYPEYNDDAHCAGVELPWMPTLPLIIGLDFGLTPAAVLEQVTPRGTLHSIDECVSEGMGIRQFLRDILVPKLAQMPAFPSVLVVGDPAGQTPAQTDERTCFDEVRAAGLNIIPARSNAFIPRREAAAGFMTKMVDGQPAYRISTRCKMLRRGYLGGYRYRRVQVVGEERYTDTPEKNQFSHPHDAHQYAAMHAAGSYQLTSQASREQIAKECAIWESIPAMGAM